MSDIIVSNEERAFEWEVDDTAIYLVENNKRYQVKTFMYFANGTRDLCSVTDEDDHVALRVKDKIKPTDTLICAWEDDALVLQFFEPIPPENRTVRYLEVNDSMVPFIDTVFRLHPMTKPKHYDAYLGRRYPRLGR